MTVRLHWFLPTSGDGRTIVERFHATGGETRVIMLTAAAGIRDRVEGLGLGADDSLTKPFAFAELVARVHALARRAVVLDAPRRHAGRDGQPLALSPKEFAVLEVLMRNAGTVVSAEDLLEKACGPATFASSPRRGFSPRPSCSCWPFVSSAAGWCARSPT